MKRETFIVVMIVEVLAALVAMGLLFSDVGAMIYPISLAVFAAVLSPFWRRLKREPDEGEKRRIRRNMALIMVVPIAAGIIGFLVVVTMLIIAFSF